MIVCAKTKAGLDIAGYIEAYRASYIAQFDAANPDDLVFPVPSPAGRRLWSSGEFLGAFRGVLSEMKTAAEPWGHRRGYGGQYGYQRRLRTGMDITPWH